MYILKVSDIKALRKMCNLPNGVKSVDFDQGTIRVEDMSCALDIAANVEIEEFKTESIPQKKASKFSNKLEIGSIVRIMDRGKCVHIVIVDNDNNNYSAAKLNLCISDKGITLEKGKDVIFKNSTYKNYTTVLNFIYNNLKLDDFLNSSSPVVGKVINMELLSQLIAKKLTSEEIINLVPSLESLISQLNLDVSTSMLAKAMILAKKMNTSDMRKLTIAIKEKYNIIQSKSDIQAQIDSEYKKITTEWITKLDRSGFLRMVVKTF